MNCLWHFKERLVLKPSHSFAKALEVDDLALTKEFDGVVNVGVIREAEDVIVGYARLLLGGKVLYEVAIRVPL